MDIISDGYNEHTISYFDLKKVKDYCHCTKTLCVDDIIVNHIAPRESEKACFSDILTLPNVLTRDTALSRYLADKGFTFIFDNNQISAKLHNHDIIWDMLDHSNISVRFGGPLEDFNINGYLFASNLVLVHCRGWLGSPEILKTISNAYNDHSIANDFVNRSKNYMISFRVSVDNIDIILTEASIDKQRKSDILIKYSINAMAYYYKEGKLDTNFPNPEIMLKRAYDVPCSDITRVRRLEVENDKVIIIDEIPIE